MLTVIIKALPSFATQVAGIDVTEYKRVVAERFDYATVFYVDALLVLAIVLVIPFLKKREAPARRPGGVDRPALAES